MAKKKSIPKDVDARLAGKERLRLAMRESIQKQGGFGVRQTEMWLDAYKKGMSAMKRDFPTTKSTKKCIDLINEACKPFSIS